MAKSDRIYDPFALKFKERDRQYYVATPEQRNVERAFKDVIVAVEKFQGGGTDNEPGPSPYQAVRGFYGTLTSSDKMLDFASFTLAEWILTPGIRRPAQSLILTLLVRSAVDEQPPTCQIREGQVSQMARVIAGMVPRLPVSEMRVFAAWAADMARGEPGHYEAQPVAVMRGVLFSQTMVRSFDAVRASEFWTRAVEEPDFPWHIFSDPCRADRGMILTEFHRATVAMILSIAPESAVRRVVAQMAEHARYRRMEVRGKDGCGGDCLNEEVVPVESIDRVRLFQEIASAVTDAHHKGRRAFVSDLFGQAG